MLPISGLGADVEEAEQLFRAGKYAECIAIFEEADEEERDDVDFLMLAVRARMATGQYAEALATYETGVEFYPRHLPLRLLGYDVYRFNNQPEDAEAVLARMREDAADAPWRYSDAMSRVALGRALLLGGADARQVLELFLDPAKKLEPELAAPYLASGELALEKYDFALAAESFREAARRAEDDPDVHFGLARSNDNDPEQSSAALARALELNPNHVDSLLLQADSAVDREDYLRAQSLLKKVLAVNPREPRAWAYRAVLAHLVGDRKREQAYRAEALKPWKSNPQVDHLLGLKVSQKYRFAEGAAYQRRALRMDRTYRPARAQLCQDLLRLGEEDEGWELAAEVFAEDPYNVFAYNLVTLHDTLAKFATLEDEHFLVRMDPREAEIYGPRVLSLLQRARESLCSKYDVTFPGRIVVEIFPQQKDFAIRTFGLPGGEGFLGVCFGSVITVNSPATRVAREANWEAILWHEFCHSVTLHKTHNKMPRWLSEGISVYEERQENPAWGQTMDPQYRKMILEDEATAVSKLSGAFLRPPTPVHLQFAYFQSSMVVEYVIDRFGMESLQRVLTELGENAPINEALARHTEPIDKLDVNFEKWFRAQAEQLAPQADLEQPEVALDADSQTMRAWNQENPKNFWGLLSEGRALIAEQKWEEAKRPLKEAVAIYPGFGEAGGPYLLLAEAHRALGETPLERAMLERHVALNAEAVEARLRLIELGTAVADWKSVRQHAEAVLAVNPLVPAPHRHLAQAAESLGERSLAMNARRTLLALDPINRAEHHYQLARLLFAKGRHPQAKREVVLALEEAPRFRAAHRLLQEIAAKTETPGAADPQSEPSPAQPRGPTPQPQKPQQPQASPPTEGRQP